MTHLAVVSMGLLAACAGDPSTVLVELSPAVISSIDGTTTVTALVSDGVEPLDDTAVHLTVAYVDRNGTPHDIAPIDGRTDARGVFGATIEGLVFDGAGTITVETSPTVSGAQTFAVLDRTPPKITIVPSATNNTVGPGLPMDVEVHVTDEIGISNVTLDATGDVQGARSTLIGSGTTDTTVRFRLQIPDTAVAGPTITLYALATDLSGNRAAAEAVVLTVDPAITVATPPGLVGGILVTGTQNQLGDPRSIAVSPKDGKLYVADLSQQGACGGGCIWQVDPATGTIAATPVVVGNGAVEGVAFDATGDNLYYTDRQDRTGRMTWNGTAYASVTTCNAIGGVLQDPYHLVFDPTLGLVTADGNDRSVIKIATCAAGTTPTRITMADALDEPRGIALGPTGELYVSDRNADRVSLVDRTTGALTAFSSAMREPYGIEWTPGTTAWGNALMVASGGERIVTAVTATTSLPAAYLRNTPIDVAFGTGTMYVLTSPNNGVRGQIYKVTGF